MGSHIRSTLLTYKLFGSLEEFLIVDLFYFIIYYLLFEMQRVLIHFQAICLKSRITPLRKNVQS